MEGTSQPEVSLAEQGVTALHQAGGHQCFPAWLWKPAGITSRRDKGLPETKHRFLFFFFYFQFSLDDIPLTFRHTGREGERNMDKLPLVYAPIGPEPAPQACALRVSIDTRDFSVYQMML